MWWEFTGYVSLATDSAQPFPVSKVPVEGTGLPDIWFGCGVLVWKKRVVRQRMSASLFKNVKRKVTLPGTVLCDGHCRNLDNKIFRDTTWVSHNGEGDCCQDESLLKRSMTEKYIQGGWEMRDKLHLDDFFQSLIVLLDKYLKVTIFTWLKIKPFCTCCWNCFKESHLTALCCSTV